MILWAVLLLIIGLAFVHFLVYLNRKGHRKIIGLTFALLLMAGTAVHVVLLARSGHTVTEGNWIQLALVSLVAGLEMFIGHTVVFDDIIAAVIFREPALMIAYLTVFVLILLFTLSMVVLIMPRRLRDRTWLILNAYKASRNRKNHIFLGLSPYSKLLAKSILQEWEGSSHKGKGEIIFVEFPSADAHHSELSIGELVSSIFGHKKELTLEEELGSEHFVLLKGHRPSGDGDNMCHAIGLDKLDKWLQNPRTSLYILNQDEQENFELLKTLARDKSVQAKGFFYTHEPDSFFSLFAHMGKRLRVLDSHYLSFMQIKLRRPEVLPVNYVDIATDKDGAPLGYVKDGLKSMIVGFGESGQEALRYLLEFGSFIGKDLEAAPSSITVYDDNLEKNRGHFLHLAPALKGDKRLRWRAETAGTDAFWEQYDAMLDEGLRYMVIAMDKGNRNVSLAIHLLQRAAQKGMDLRKMIILVRIWRSDPNIEELINYYNRAYAPEDVRVIRIFGRMETIWKPDVISGRSLKQTAIRFSEAFQAASGNGESWDERRVRLSKPGGNPLAKQQELMRRQAMEIGRALFAPTLLRFAAKNLKDAAKDIPSAYSKETAWHYPGDKDTYTRLEYLAAAEHLHWMSQLEVNGYQDGPDDELLLTHTNMIPYKEITDPVLRHMCWIGVKTALTLE